MLQWHLLIPVHPSRHGWKHFLGHHGSAQLVTSCAALQGDVPTSAVTLAAWRVVAGGGGWPLARVFHGTFVFLCSRGSD